MCTVQCEWCLYCVQESVIVQLMRVLEGLKGGTHCIPVNYSPV